MQFVMGCIALKEVDGTTGSRRLQVIGSDRVVTHDSRMFGIISRENCRMWKPKRSYPRHQQEPTWADIWKEKAIAFYLADH